MIERETETERKTDREKERDKERDTDRETERQTDRQTDREKWFNINVRLWAQSDSIQKTTSSLRLAKQM